jgi:hypothetical protein
MLVAIPAWFSLLLGAYVNNRHRSLTEDWEKDVSRSQS